MALAISRWEKTVVAVLIASELNGPVILLLSLNILQMNLPDYICSSCVSPLRSAFAVTLGLLPSYRTAHNDGSLVPGIYPGQLLFIVRAWPLRPAYL